MLFLLFMYPQTIEISIFQTFIPFVSAMLYKFMHLFYDKFIKHLPSQHSILI